MKGKVTVNDAKSIKSESMRNPDKPIFTEDHLDAEQKLKEAAMTRPLDGGDVAARSARLKSRRKEEQPLEAAKGNDELMSQPPHPNDQPCIKIDSDLKVARQETAQENIHEVMTRKKARTMDPFISSESADESRASKK